MSENYNISDDSDIIGVPHASPEVDMGDWLMVKVRTFSQLKRLKMSNLGDHLKTGHT